MSHLEQSWCDPFRGLSYRSHCLFINKESTVPTRPRHRDWPIQRRGLERGHIRRTARTSGMRSSAGPGDSWGTILWPSSDNFLARRPTAARLPSQIVDRISTTPPPHPVSLSSCGPNTGPSRGRHKPRTGQPGRQRGTPDYTASSALVGSLTACKAAGCFSLRLSQTDFQPWSTGRQQVDRSTAARPKGSEVDRPTELSQRRRSAPQRQRQDSAEPAARLRVTFRNILRTTQSRPRVSQVRRRAVPCSARFRRVEYSWSRPKHGTRVTSVWVGVSKKTAQPALARRADSTSWLDGSTRYRLAGRLDSSSPADSVTVTSIYLPLAGPEAGVLSSSRVLYVTGQRACARHNGRHGGSDREMR